MNLSDNKYFYEIMSKYFLILIEMNLYHYRFNRIFLNEHNDNKALGIFEAMKELAELGEKVVCVNFDPNFPVQEIENLSFIDSKLYGFHKEDCDFLFVYGYLNSKIISNLSRDYNPKFIFHC